MKLKAGHIILFIVAGVVLGGGVWYSLSSGPEIKLATSFHMIDVTTGEVFEVDTSKGAVRIPAPHPDTGKDSLVRIEKDESGVWRVSTRDQEMVTYLIRNGVKAQDVDKIIDRRSGAVRVDVPRKTRSYHNGDRT